VPRSGPCSRAASVVAASFLKVTCAFPRLAAEGGREGADPLLRLLADRALEAHGKQPSAPRATGMGTGGERLLGRNSFVVPTRPHSLPQTTVCASRWGNCWRQSNTSDFSLIPIMCTQNTRSSLSFGASQSCIVHHHHLCFKYMTQLKY
jgi:hypothetical protein